MAQKKKGLTNNQVLYQAAGFAVEPQGEGNEAIQEKIAGKDFEDALKILSENRVEQIKIHSGDESFELKLHSIPHAQIKNLTEVHEENARFQHWLNPYAIDKLMHNMIENTQHSPALGFFCKTKNKILIVDGSCRRFSAIKGNLDYLVYVSEKILRPDIVNKLSQNTNIHVQQSIVEYGNIHIKDIKELGHSVYEHSIYIKEDKEIVRRRVKAAEFYNSHPSLIDSFPAPSQVGWKTFNYLIREVGEMTQAQVDNLIKSLPPKSNIETNSSTVNKCHFDRLKLLIKEIKSNKEDEVVSFQRINIGDNKEFGTIKKNRNGTITISLLKNTKEAHKALSDTLKKIK